MEGLYLAQAALALHELGVLAAMETTVTAEELAAQCGVDAAMLRGTLDYVAERTTLVRKTGEGYGRTEENGREAEFLFDLYGGAYGGNAAGLARVLKNPRAAARMVDRGRHAAAFAKAGGEGNAWIAAVVRDLGWNRVLDIGCGPAAMLVELARGNEGFAGWGLEFSEAMREAARRNIRGAGVGRRVRVLEGDLKRMETAVPEKVLSKVEAVTACQAVNELFGNGTSGAVAWLRRLRRMLPGRPLLIADYYGRLGNGRKAGRNAVTLLHDYAQLLSGQGVPPAGIEEWVRIYESAGVRPVHVVEDVSSTRFLHIVVL